MELEKKNKKGKNTGIRATISEYCESSSIHGVRYLAEKDRPFRERFIWIVAFGVSVAICWINIRDSYDKWSEMPVLVSFAEKPTLVHEIPFPAVTICPETKSIRTKFDFAKFYTIYNKNRNLLSKNEQFQFSALAEICTNRNFSYGKVFEQRRRGEFLKSVAPSIFYDCRWKTNIVNCDEIFDPILTNEGICYTFNSFTMKELYSPNSTFDSLNVESSKYQSNWSLDDGYVWGSGSSAYPFRTFSGPSGGLQLRLIGNADDDCDICQIGFRGFKLYLHMPGDVPDTSKGYYHVPFGQEVVLAMKPGMIATTDALVGYQPQQRFCFFQHERKLRYYKIYTQANCLQECLSNFTLFYCNCVRFAGPRSTTARVCGGALSKCYLNAENFLLKAQFEAIQKPDGNKYSCNCLPTCTSISYDTEFSKAFFNETMAQKLNFAEHGGVIERNATRMLQVIVFFKQENFISKKRTYLYNMTDYMAKCGGLLGLFMGISALSIIEVLYFFSLRCFNNLMLRKRK